MSPPATTDAERCAYAGCGGSRVLTTRLARALARNVRTVASIPHGKRGSAFSAVQLTLYDSGGKVVLQMPIGPKRCGWTAAPDKHANTANGSTATESPPGAINQGLFERGGEAGPP